MRNILEKTRDDRTARRWMIGWVIAACLAAASPIPGTAADLPAADGIIDAYIEATGGADAYAGHRNWVGKGVFEMAAMGLKASVTTYFASPDLSYTLIESDMIGRMESGSVDGVYWEKSLMGGARIKTGEEKAAAQREATFDKWTKWRDLYETARTVGTEEIDGAVCHLVEMTPKEGRPETFYFDAETHLLVKHAFSVETEMGVVSMEAYMTDYRETGGILVPFTSRQVLMGMQEIVFSFDSIEYDTELPDGIFDLPADIQALLGE